MKLWQKIFLWTLLTVMAAVSTIVLLLLKRDFDDSMKMQMERVISEHSYMVSNISNKMVATRLQENSILLNSNQIITVMKDIFDDSRLNPATVVALFNTDSKVLYNNAPIRIDTSLLKEVFRQKELSDDSNVCCTQILTIDKRPRLFVASPVILEKQNYVFVTSTDISQLRKSYEKQIRDTKYMCILLSLICAMILLVLSRLLLRPLATLNRTTSAIASGNYGERIRISSKDELGELSASMNVMADSIEKNVDQLREVAENRNTFINNLAHEMKTPLTSILGFSDIMRIKRAISEEEIAEYSGIIFDEATRLKNLSGKLMELITIGETNLEFTPINATDLFSQIESVMQPIMAASDITLQTACEPCLLSIDLELMKSMLFNLLDNAKKASSKGSCIWLKGKKQGARYAISVIDQGIGMAAKDIDRVTEPFYMVDKARSRKAGGVGLGLALCKSIAEIHLATFEIKSELSKGTTVTITLKEADI